jgi:TolB-like protein
MGSRIRSVLAELKRRKVSHVAVAYVAVGLGVLGAAEVILDPLGLEGARPYVVILVLLGFPLALVLAWAYEVRPESPAAEPVVAASQPTSDAAFWNPAPEEETPATPSPPPEGQSIAVLPFESMSADPEGDYFADGITEELTNALARQAGLRVSARTSAFAFKGERVDAREVGKRLNVSHLIEGSVRRSDQALRITAQLINTRDGYHVWSEQYDRDHGDVFKIQEEIAGCVVRRLLGDASQEPEPSIARADLSAYDAFLKGRYALAQYHPKALLEAIGHFQSAIEIDDRFAPALAGLAEALTVQSIGFSDRPSNQTMPMAGKSAARALDLDPSLPEAHLARALARMYGEWDYTGAKNDLDQALELNPNFVEAHIWEEFYWTYVQHDFERALAANRRAQRVSPLDPRVSSRFGTVHYLFGEFERAEEIFREELIDHPEDPLFHVGLGDTLFRMDRGEEGLAHVEKAARLGGGVHTFQGMLAGFCGTMGLEEKAGSLLEEMEERNRAGYASGFWMAVGYGGMGRMDEAFSSLERAVQQGDSNLLYLFFVPRGLGLHGDPRFDGIIERIGLGHLLQFK